MGPLVAYYRPELAADLAKYANASDVWLNLGHGIEQPENAAMRRGKAAEPRLRIAYHDAYGGEAEQHERPWVVPHPRFPWAAVSPDDVVLLDGQRVYVEYKSSIIFALYPPATHPPTKWGPPESDEVPDLYQLQVQHGLEILDLPVAHLFVGFGRDEKDANGNPTFLYQETRRYILPRRPQLAAMALEHAARFHREHIETRMPPSLAPCHNKRAFARLLKEQPWKTEATEAHSS